MGGKGGGEGRVTGPLKKITFLQLPFPDDALADEVFIRYLKNPILIVNY